MEMFGGERLGMKMGMVGGMIDGAEVDCFHGKKCRPESVDEMNTRKERAKSEEKIAKTHHKKNNPY